MHFEKSVLIFLSIEKDSNIEMAFVQKSTPTEDQKEMIENEEQIEGNIINYSPIT